MNTEVVIALGVLCCFLLVIGVVVGVYFSGVACPNFGSDCSSGTPATITPSTTPPSSGNPPPVTPPPVTPPPVTPPPVTPPPVTPSSCPSGQWSPSGTTPCNQCSEPTPTQYVTAICTSSQNTQVAPIACPAGSATQSFDTGSSSRLGTRICVQNVASTTPPPGQACPAGEQIVNGVCRVCPEGYNYNSLIQQCYAEI
jgi:hypothetical protein